MVGVYRYVVTTQIGPVFSCISYFDQRQTESEHKDEKQNPNQSKRIKKQINLSKLFNTSVVTDPCYHSLLLLQPLELC